MPSFGCRKSWSMSHNRLLFTVTPPFSLSNCGTITKMLNRTLHCHFGVVEWSGPCWELLGVVFRPVPSFVCLLCCTWQMKMCLYRKKSQLGEHFKAWLDAMSSLFKLLHSSWTSTIIIKMQFQILMQDFFHTLIK